MFFSTSSLAKKSAISVLPSHFFPNEQKNFSVYGKIYRLRAKPSETRIEARSQFVPGLFGPGIILNNFWAQNSGHLAPVPTLQNLGLNQGFPKPIKNISGQKGSSLSIQKLDVDLPALICHKTNDYHLGMLRHRSPKYPIFAFLFSTLSYQNWVPFHSHLINLPSAFSSTPTLKGPINT